MSVLVWVAAAWLAATCLVTLCFFGARRSGLLYRYLFGERPTAEVVRLRMSADRPMDRPTRIAA